MSAHHRQGVPTRVQCTFDIDAEDAIPRIVGHVRDAALALAYAHMVVQHVDALKMRRTGRDERRAFGIARNVYTLCFGYTTFATNHVDRLLG